MKNKTVTLGSDIKNESITLSETALHQQLTALGVYDPLISFLECLTILGQTKNETTKSLKREIAEKAYVKQLAAVRKMCGMEQPLPQPVTIPKRSTFGTKEGVTSEQQAELFD